MIISQFDVIDQKLQNLAGFVPNILAQSRAENTLKKYKCYFEQWIQWCNLFSEINPLPVQEQYIVLFIVLSLQEGKSFSIIDATISAVRYFHSILGYQVGKSNMVKHILEAAKRILAHPVDKKLAFTVKDLRSAVDILDDNKLKDVRTKVIMLLSFAGFLRFSECQNLRRSDIQIFQDYAMIFIEKSKTDIYRNGYRRAGRDGTVGRDGTPNKSSF